MKKVLIIFLVAQFSFLVSTAQTDSLNIREVFRSMPDSLTAYLSTNNKLDMIDFMDAKMKAAVNNKLGGESQMLYLSDDSLCVMMSAALQIELWLEKNDTAALVVMKRTYQIAGCQKEVLINRFTSSWHPVGDAIVHSTLLRRDDEVFAKPHF